MKKSKLLCLLVSFTLCLTVLGGLVSPQVASADPEEEEPAPEPVFELQAKYPSMEGPADTTFEFEIGFAYRQGKQALDFELIATAPEGWLVYIAESSYNKDKRITAVRLETYSVAEKVVVIAVAPFWLFPEPGDYTITVDAVSEELSDSVDLTARITARYDFVVETSSGRLNTKATAGKESSLSIVLTNTGTAVLDRVSFSSSKPSGINNEEWKVTFEPDKVEGLGPWEQQEVEVTISPPSKTIAGDYMTTLKFDSDPDPSSEPPKLDIRVTVSTPTKWGLIGAFIVVAVIAGVVLVFRRYGRR